MTITGHTRAFLVLGDPIAQVQAQTLFNPWFRQHGVDALRVPAQMAAADFRAFARQALRSRNIDGLWLNIPHKAAMVGLLDHSDQLGTVAGADSAALHCQWPEGQDVGGGLCEQRLRHGRA